HCRLIICGTHQNLMIRDWVLAHGGLFLTGKDLTFTDQDIQGLTINPDGLDDVEKSLFGWPLAYALARQKPQENAGKLLEEACDAFSLRLLSRLGDEARMVLYAACLAEQFDVEYLVSVTENPDSPALLKPLMAAGFFEKSAYNTFAINPVFRQGVLNEFQYLAWNARKSLKTRAAIYWAGNQRYEQALSFCERYQLWDASVEVLHRVAEPFINAGRFEEMHKWFEALPPEYIDHDPLLMVYRVWCFPEYQKINGAAVYLQQVEQMLATGDPTSNKQQWLKAKVHLSALRGYICRISGDYHGAVEHAQSAVDYACEGYPAILSRLYTTIGQDLYLKGDVVAATASLTQATALGKQYKKHHDVIIALGYTVAALEMNGRFSKAIELFGETLQWFEESGFMKTEGSDILNDLLTDAYRETFQLDKAASLSENMLRFCEKTTPALHHLTTFIRRYRLAISKADSREAYFAVTQAEAFRDLLGVSWAFGWAPVSAMRPEYELRFGNPARADTYFSEREPVLSGSLIFSTECERFVYALWLEKQGRIKEAKEQLVRIRDTALTDQRFYHVIKANVQLALLVREQDPAGAVLHLRDAIRAVPEDEQIIGPFLWFGQQIVPLLEQVGSQLYQDLDGLRLLKTIRQNAQAIWPQQDRVCALDVLSERQVTILKLLINGDQDKVIARKLDISPGTVKTHLRAIYRKLNCNNRSQAVSIAMEEGVLLLDNQGAN
ncbi:MAG: LuxR C-terminal-related transcriptional regulator, partial [Ketobacteraceae bacterium]|nr:LuxR C-terminal-related transcriptional regulator [Ketobacteraceae bacterium]